MNQKGLIGIIVLIAFLVIGVGTGAYYLGKIGNTTQTQQLSIPPSTESPTSNNVNSSPSSSPNSTLKTESFQLQKSTAVSGNENIKITMQIPSSWTFQKIERSSNNNVIITNCADYWVTNNNSRLIISPVCTGWAATYSPWPSNAIQVKTQMNVGNDAHTTYTVRYFDQSRSQYVYVDGDKSSNQVQDAVLATYNTNFVPFHITLSSNNDSDINLADQIISSLRASTQ